MPPHFAGLAADLFPPLNTVVFVTSYGEAVAVLRDSHLAPVRLVVADRDADAHRNPPVTPGIGTGSPSETASTTPPSFRDIFRDGLPSSLSGHAHTQRRRALNPLFGRDAHAWLRDYAIVPALTRNLNAVLDHPDEDGSPRTDLVPFAGRVFIQATAALVGFDGVDTEARADELLQLHALIRAGMHADEALPNSSERTEQLRSALEARLTLLERFYRPSLERRRELLQRRSAGEISAEGVPHDLLTLIADRAATFDTEQQGLAQALQLLEGSVGTNTKTLLDCLAALSDWFSLSPENAAKRSDPRILEGGLYESIRLGSLCEVFMRRALADISLPSGRQIKSGQFVVVLATAANRDRAVFGGDADVFNPTRKLPAGVYPYGLGFGSGPHMCIALPIVIGQGELAGMQVPIVQALYAAGMRRDLALPARKHVEWAPHIDDYATFPVVFDARA